MKTVAILPVLAVFAVPGASFSQTRQTGTQGGCATYIGVLQDDPKIPGRYVARLTKS
jgi:hypothetical protein